jgi:hypothetical protein
LEIHEISLDRFGQPVIPVTINGDIVFGTFDTGNMTGLSLSDSLATRLKLPVAGDTQMLDSDGNPVSVSHMYSIDNLNVFGNEFGRVTATEEYRGALACLVGPRFMLGGRVTIDYANHLLGFSKRKLNDIPEGAASIPLIQSPVHEGLVLVRGFVHGRKVLMELDTGKSRTVIDPSLAKSLDLEGVSHGVHIDSLLIGNNVFSVRSAKLAGLSSLGQGLDDEVLVGVGSDILSKIVLTVDYANDRVLILQ